MARIGKPQWLLFRGILGGMLLAIGASAVFAQTPCTLDRATGTTIEKASFLRNGYSVRWHAGLDRLAYMQPAANGYYRIFTANPDGSGITALSEQAPGLPKKHHGSPHWHPSGKYLLLVAQKQDWSGRKLFGNPDYEALPGFGRHDDMWLIAADASQSWQLTDEPNTVDQGVLIPVWSADGKHVAWSSRQPGGKYVLKVADFLETPQPHLSEVRSFQPGGKAYYETGSFTSDGKSLIYTSDQDTHDFWHSQIYRLDLDSGKATRLTVGTHYNEHPSLMTSPIGDWVVYMSTEGVDRYPWQLFLGTDWWAMRPDGSGKKRLTRMNINRKDNPQNEKALRVAGTIAPSPDGTWFLGDVQDSLTKQTGQVRVVRFTCPPQATAQ